MRLLLVCSFRYDEISE